LPQLSQYTLAWSDQSGRYELQNGPEVLSVDAATWINWLNEHHSFAFVGAQGRLSLLKERRKAGYDYWYAYRRRGKRVAKRYAGRSAELTFARLEELSQALSEDGEQPGVPQLEAKPSREKRAKPEATIPLLTSKIRLPHLPRALVQRERLLTQLDSGREGKLTLVNAPAGFGKTTLIRQWLARVSAKNPQTVIAWLSLDLYDNDLLRFWRYLITACRVFAPNMGVQSLGLLDASIALQASIETLPMVFINELENIQAQGFLVLEDYHSITAPLIHETLGFLINYLPHALHMVIISRTTPPLPLARLRVANELIEIEAPDLQFSETETSEFFRLNMNVPISSDELDEVVQRVEGWAAGLRLLTLAMQGLQDVESRRLVLENFVAGRRGIGDYFVTEVLNNQPEALQQFLLQTSFLNRLTASLCESVTLRKDSQDLLEALQQANLFLEPLDGVERWYRYHALFAAVMQTEARHRLGEAAVRELAERAGYWYEAHQMLEEAVNIAFSVQDIDRAADLISHVLEREYSTEQAPQQPPEFYTIESWLAQLPQSLIDARPLFSLAIANAFLFASIVEMRTLSTAETQNIEHLLMNAERGFKMTAETYLLSQTYVIRAMLSRELGQLRQAVAWAETALPLLPDNEFMWRSVCVSTLGQSQEYDGHLSLAAARYAEAQRLCEKIGNDPFARANGIMVGRVYLEQNKFHQAVTLFRRILTEAKTVGDISDINHALCGLAEVALAWNDLDAAMRQAAEAIEVVRQYPHTSGYVAATLILASVEGARGAYEAARTRCESLLVGRASGDSLPGKQQSATIAFVQARLALIAGDLGVAQRWHINRVHDLDQPRVRSDEDALLHSRMLIAAGKAGEAAIGLDRIIADAGHEGRERIALESRVILALAYAALNQQQNACDALTIALSEARPANIQRIFIEAGEPMARLLRATLPGLTDRAVSAFARTILRAIPNTAAAPEAPLSQQEQRVLRLIAAGHSNADIAATLVVSVNTVKAHIKVIYRKLKVNNRVDAARVAQELDLV
jgi:LuxR family maltose regulon positive regulatory protein